MNATWYQVRFSFDSTSKSQSINGILLSRYIQSLHEAEKRVSNAFIMDVFALNIRNNKFDKSFPPLLFLKCSKNDLTVLKHILKEGNIQFIDVHEVSEQLIDYYRNEHAKAEGTIWSSVCFSLHTITAANVDKCLSTLLQTLTHSAEQRGIKIHQIICPNIARAKQGDYHRPIVAYIQHDSADNEKVEQLLRFPRNVIKGYVDKMTYMVSIGNIGDETIKSAERIAAETDIKLSNVNDYPVYKPREIVYLKTLDKEACVVEQNLRQVVVIVRLFDAPVRMTTDVSNIVSRKS